MNPQDRWEAALRRSGSALVLAVALWALGAGAGIAHAGDDAGAVAVLPLTSAKPSLALYGVPVARVLAVQLRKSAGGSTVETVSGGAALPKRIAWVIDGRIVDRPGGKVVLEARLRDPDLGSALGQVVTRPGKLTEIDRLARDLAHALAPLLERARRDRGRAHGASAHRTAGAGVGAGAGAETSGGAAAAATHQAPAGGGARGRASAPADPRPALLVGHAAGDTRTHLPIDAIVAGSARAMAARLGFRPMTAALSGIARPAVVSAALRGAGAHYALLTRLVAIDFSWRGVLTAHGTVRVTLVDASGNALYDELIDTDTVVGSRGDSHSALLGFVARQAMDIARPAIHRLLARR